MEKRDYYLGLDMGTSSVGWAVTDKNYNILRAKGKDLWGIREFDEAKTSTERRGYRTGRRRNQRNKARKALLKSYFADEINKVDPNFYVRLENSFFQQEDKSEEVRYKNIYFNDKGYKDKDYFKEYPTIFHLRYDLITNPADHDVRLVFLACLNIFEHRGHFLNEGLRIGDNEVSIQETYIQLQNLLSDSLGMVLPAITNEEKFKSIMSDRGQSRKSKAEAIQELLGVTKQQKNLIEIIKCLVGLNADACKMFGLERDEKVGVELSSATFDEKTAELEQSLGEELFDAINLMKRIYDACAWNAIISGSSYLSEARVKAYQKHHEDLVILKRIVKKIGEEEYERFFRSSELGTYGDYAGSVNSHNKKTRRLGNHKQDVLYGEIKKLLAKAPDSKDVEYVLSEIEKGTFLPKQLTGENGVIPYQAHLAELQKILDNASAYLPFLLNKDEKSGLTVKEQIIEVFKFRLPYYVGPVTTNSEKNGGNGWVVRKAEGPVRPWNIETKIDLEKTSERFIKRLIRKCTYLSDEKVMPKCSLLYEKYAVLNELNSICIDGERLDPEIKQDLYEELFLKGKTVTKNAIAKKLQERGLLDSKDQISGIDEKINSTLSSYKKFYKIFGDDLKKDSYKEMAEAIVYWGTIFGDSKEQLQSKLTQEFASKLNENQLQSVLKLKFKDWGKLSREFLLLQGMDCDTGEVVSLIDALWNTNHNLMELLHSPQYTFGQALEEKTNKSLKPLNEMTIDDLAELYISAPVRRMVWQTLLVIREIEHVMGRPATRVFVEVTRGDGEKKRTTSRKDAFLALYKNIKEGTDWKAIINKADADGTIRSKKMYLYLKQKGKDLYTGKEIDIEKLFDDNLYDIDHIYPQSLTKDDNLDNNMVLTDKTVNNHKQDDYPLEESIRKGRHGLWKELHNAGFINDEKYKRLTSSSPLTDEQLAGFVARQLVETSQATKVIADILKNALPDSKVVYSKAKVVSDFRNKYGIYKSRSVNDFHHAHDAYLNIVVGNAYFCKFTDNPIRFIKEKYAKDKTTYQYNLAKFFERDVTNGKETAWIGSGKQKDGESNNQGTIVLVKKMLSKNTPLLTRRSFVGHGGISDATIYNRSTALGEGYLPLKMSDERMTVEKYGGKAKASTAYFFLVESEVKGKKVRTIETVPVYLAGSIEKDSSVLEKYCVENLGLKKPSIRIRKIRIQSLVKRNGYYACISGKTGNRLKLRNGTSLKIESKWVGYTKKIDKYIEKKVIDSSVTKELNEELYDVLLIAHTQRIFAKRPSPIGEKLALHKEDFENLTLEKQLYVLDQIFHTMQLIPDASADLTDLNESKSTGVILYPKKVTGAEECLLINQSVTGIYEQTIDLLTV